MREETSQMAYLPNGISMNSKEFKQLQNRYLKSNQPKNSHQPVALPQPPNADPQKPHGLPLQQPSQIMDYYANYDYSKRIQQQDMLANELTYQINTKNQKKKAELQHSLEMESSLLRHIDELTQQEDDKRRKYKEKVMQELKRDDDFRRERKNMEKQHIVDEKNNEKKRCSDGEVLRYNKMRGNGNAMISNPTQNYIYEMEEAKLLSKSKNFYREAEQVNPQSSLNPNMPKRSASIPQLMAPSLEDAYTSRLDFQRQTRLQLRDSLLSQIEQQKSRRQLERQQEFMWGRGGQAYKGVHHPICNPMDLKFAHDNHLVLKQLSSLK